MSKGIIYLLLAMSITESSWALMQNITISDDAFNFTTYKSIADFNQVEPQPFVLLSDNDLTYSHVFGNLRSTVQGTLKEIKYLSVGGRAFSFQVWERDANGTFKLKALIPVTPSAEGQQSFTPSTPVIINVGDTIGIWIDTDYPFAVAKEENQAVADYFLLFGGWTAGTEPVVSSSQAPDTTLDTVAQYNGVAYLPAVEMVVEYDELSQPETTTTTTTTPTTTTTTTTESTTTTTVAATTTATTTVTAPSLPTTTSAPTNTNITVEEVTTPAATTEAPVEKSTTKSAAETTSSASKTTTKESDINPDATTQPSTGEDNIISGDLLYVIVGSAAGVFLVLVIFAVIFCCVKRKQAKDIEKIAELKRSYQAGGGHVGSKTSVMSDMVYDYEEAEPYPQYPQANSNTAYQPDTMGGTYARINKPQKATDSHSDLTTTASPADDSPKASVIMLNNDLYEQTDPATMQHYSEKSTKC